MRTGTAGGGARTTLGVLGSRRSFRSVVAITHTRGAAREARAPPHLDAVAGAAGGGEVERAVLVGGRLGLDLGDCAVVDAARRLRRRRRRRGRRVLVDGARPAGEVEERRERRDVRALGGGVHGVEAALVADRRADGAHGTKMSGRLP